MDATPLHCRLVAVEWKRKCFIRAAVIHLSQFPSFPAPAVEVEEVEEEEAGRPLAGANAIKNSYDLQIED